MITKPTVLILGAGASVDYGFPTGRELLFNVCRELKERGSALRQFLEVQKSMASSHITNFGNTLAKSSAPSVDLFLEKNPDFEEIGKLAIALTLILLERPEEFQPKLEKRWYETLFHWMVQDGAFEDNKLSIVTFNYDRSIEAFFFSTLQNLYHMDSTEAQKRLDEIPIIHIHGSLGKGVSPTGGQRGYEPNIETRWVISAANGIRVLHQGGEDKEIDRAAWLIERAKEVIFLGFSFHDVNMKRLRLDRIDHNVPKSWFACRTGMGAGDIERVQIKYKFLVDRFAPDYRWKIDQFLSETHCLLP